MKAWTDIELLSYLDHAMEINHQQELEKQLLIDATLAQRVKDLKNINLTISEMHNKIPSQRLKDNFYAFLENEKQKIESQKKHSVRIVNLRWLAGIAAGLLFFVTVFFIYQNDQTKSALNQLNNELAQTKSRMFHQLESGSTSARIQAVNQTYRMNEVDPEILTTLIETFVKDDNAIVRLAALEAISNYADENTLKKLLLDNIKIEKDASIQITMIHLLTSIKPSGAVKSLEDLIKDDEVLEEVKGEAQMSIYKIDNQKM